MSMDAQIEFWLVSLKVLKYIGLAYFTILIFVWLGVMVLGV